MSTLALRLHVGAPNGGGGVSVTFTPAFGVTTTGPNSYATAQGTLPGGFTIGTVAVTPPGTPLTLSDDAGGQVALIGATLQVIGSLAEGDYTIEISTEADGGAEIPANPGAPAPPPKPTTPPGSSGRVLAVGPGKTYATVADAMAAAQNGDTITVAPDTPRETIAIDKAVLLDGTGVKWDFADVPQSGLKWSKAAILPIVNGWHIRGFEISGCGIRETQHQLVCAVRGDGDGWGTIESCKLHDNQNGIGWGEYNLMLTVQNCELSANGLGDGLTHNLYVNDIHTLTVLDTTSADPAAGHCLKSRAWNTRVDGCMLWVAEGSCVDAPEGGVLWVRNTTFAKPAQASDHKFLCYAEENQNRGALATSTVDGCTFDLACPNPATLVQAGTLTFGPGCRWSGNKPTNTGGGTVVGLPA